MLFYSLTPKQYLEQQRQSTNRVAAIFVDNGIQRPSGRLLHVTHSLYRAPQDGYQMLLGALKKVTTCYSFSLQSSWGWLLHVHACLTGGRRPTLRRNHRAYYVYWWWKSASIVQCGSCWRWKQHWNLHSEYLAQICVLAVQHSLLLLFHHCLWKTRCDPSFAKNGVGDHCL